MRTCCERGATESLPKKRTARRCTKGWPRYPCIDTSRRESGQIGCLFDNCTRTHGEVHRATKRLEALSRSTSRVLEHPTCSFESCEAKVATIEHPWIDSVEN